MDPIEFIDSIDIRNYLHEIAYECDPIQAAYLIWQSHDKTLAEKRKARRWLIENTFDMPVPKRNWVKGWDSLHDMLQNYMAVEDILIECLFDTTPYYVYQAVSQELFGELNLAESFETCRIEVIETLDDIKECLSGDESIFIHRLPIISNLRFQLPKITAEFDMHGGLLDITADLYNKEGIPWKIFDGIDLDAWNLSFDGMWFDFPIPFERGDIVRDRRTGNIFVLEGTTPWFYKEHSMDTAHHGDNTDMDAYGICTSCLVNMIEGRPYCADDRAPYLQIEHYHGDFKDTERLLAAYSAYLKGKVAIDKFLYYSQFVLHETKAQSMQEIAGYIEKKFKDSWNHR